MTQEELINVFKYIVKKYDMLINNSDYKADDYTQDTVEDIAELCNHVLDKDCGKSLEGQKVNLEEKAAQLSQKYFPDEENIWARANIEALRCKSACMEMAEWINAQKGE